MEKNIDRREFLKRMGAGAAVIGATSALNSCSGGAGSAMIENIDPAGSGTKPIGDMTYRINHECGDKVSILGYGCMRWPNDPKTGVIDQETVNRLVDTAIEHGVNYFDTSPAYLRGLSERSTGIALKRHPRDKYFIATKLSNFAEQQKSREASIALYNKSFTELQVDYIDYMLLHSIGGSMEDFDKRYIRNGILDFLVGEKKKGKIRNLGFSYHGDNMVFDHVMKMHDEGQYHWDFVQIQMNYVDWITGNCRYLYEELTKRNIPIIIMEPLLGGRLSKLPNHVIASSKRQCRFMGFPLSRHISQHPHCAFGHDIYGAPRRQSSHLLSARTVDRRGYEVSRRGSTSHLEVPYHTVQRLQVLHALPLWSRHPWHPPALQ